MCRLKITSTNCLTQESGPMLSFCNLLPAVESNKAMRLDGASNALMTSEIEALA